MKATDYGLCLSASDFIDSLHLVRIMADARYFKRRVGRNEKRRAVGNTRVDVAKRFVIPFVPRLQRLVDGRITAEERLCKTVLPRGEFSVAAWASSDYDVEVIAKLLEVAKGDPVGKTAVEILSAADCDRARDERHGG